MSLPERYTGGGLDRRTARAVTRVDRQATTAVAEVRAAERVEVARVQATVSVIAEAAGGAGLIGARNAALRSVSPEGAALGDYICQTGAISLAGQVERAARRLG